MAYANVLLRRLRNAVNRMRLKNKGFSLFASNCNGACILHDLGLPFRSPFVNLWMTAPDFVKLLESPRDYLAADLEFTEESGYAYPVARLLDVAVYFMHYETASEAEAAWLRRCERVNWEDVFVLMTDQDGCDEDILRRFDALPYQHKVIFTHVPRPDIPSAVYIPGFEEQEAVGDCVEFINGWSGKRYYDYFDYLKWFNSVEK